MRSVVKNIVNSLLTDIDKCIKQNAYSWNFHYPAKVKLSEEEVSYMDQEIRKVYADTVSYRADMHGDANVIHVKNHLYQKPK